MVEHKNFKYQKDKNVENSSKNRVFKLFGFEFDSLIPCLKRSQKALEMEVFTDFICYREYRGNQKGNQTNVWLLFFCKKSIPWIPIEPSEPVEPETPDNGGDNQTETPDTETLQTPVTETKKEGTAPKTGDTTSALPVAGAGVASLGVALATILKKRK